MFKPFHSAQALLLAACLAPSATGTAFAQEYPTRPIKFVVGFGPGGLGDTITRAVAQKMTASMGQSVIVENMPGAGGITAAAAVAKAPADGYTLLLVSGQNAIAPLLFKSLPFDPVENFAMLSTIGTFHFILVTDKDSPLKTVRDVTAAAQKDPARFNMGTISVGSAQYLTARLFASMAKIDPTIVPFKTTGEIVTSLRAGDIQVGMETTTGVIGQVRQGALRAIATSAPNRLPFMPDVPTFVESGVPGYVSESWNGFVAPAKTPRNVVMRLNQEIAKALSAPDLQKRFTELGLEPRASSPEALKEVFLRDFAKWRTVIEQAKIEKQ